MDWFVRDFDHPLYFRIYENKVEEAEREGAALAALLGLPRGSRVLDLPCGWGRLRPWLEALGFEVTGGDLSPLNLQRHHREYGPRAVRLDLRSLPFQDGCADGVFCAFTSWGYFATEAENLGQLQEFARVLRPGGVLLLDLVGRHWLESAISPVENIWYDADEGYRERVRWSPDGQRVWTDRIMEGERFRHDIWIPRDDQVRDFLDRAGFDVDQVWGGLEGEPWSVPAERWIYRALRR